MDNSSYIYVSDKDNKYYHISDQCPNFPKSGVGRMTVAVAKSQGMRLCEDCEKGHNEIFNKGGGCISAVFLLVGIGSILPATLLLF